MKTALAAFRKETETLKASESKRDAETFFSELRDEGILLPAMFDQAVAIDQKLDDTTREEYRALLSVFEKRVEINEEHTAFKKKAGAGTTPQTKTELSTKIRAFQKPLQNSSGLTGF